MVISLTIANYEVKRVSVDNEKSIDMLFYEAFQKMNLPTQKMCKMTTPLVGFTRDAILIEGVIELPVVTGRVPTEAMVSLGFLVVHSFSAYNIILKRLGLNAL